MTEITPHSEHIQWLKYIDLFSAHPDVKKNQNGRLWDPVRKSWLAAQPEEWVRLCLTHYLFRNLNFSLRRMSVERSPTSSSLGRFDLTLHDKKGEAFLLCECKSPSTAYHLDHWLQLTQYNSKLKARFIMWTNGPQAWLWDNQTGRFVNSLNECIDQYL